MSDSSEQSQWNDAFKPRTFTKIDENEYVRQYIDLFKKMMPTKEQLNNETQ